jgi:ribosomal protein S18 acetylase RimI-like enzyme
MSDLRSARPEHAPQLAAIFHEGFESFRDFAPAGWNPPADLEGPDEFATALARPDVWGRVIGGDADIEAYVMIKPATQTRGGDDLIPGLGHLWMLFVRREHWGKGHGRTLLAEAVAELRRRDYEEARLSTPTRNRRSRALYERAGWRAVTSAEIPDLGLRVTEYRLKL